MGLSLKPLLSARVNELGLVMRSVLLFLCNLLGEIFKQKGTPERMLEETVHLVKGNSFALRGNDVE